jgi:membrane protein
MTSVPFDEGDRSHGRGRNAVTPQEIPAKGWKDILLRVLGNVGDDRVTLIAAGVTYFLLLSIFPTVTAFVSIYGLFADPGTVAKQLSLLNGVVPAGGLAIIQDQLARLTQAPPAGLSIALVISLVVALWSASAGVRALFDAMNAVYRERETRNIVWVFVLSILFTLGLIVVALVMFGVVIAIPAVLSIIGFGKQFAWVAQLAGYALLVVLLFLSLSVLYRFGPSREEAKWRWITPGSTLAVVVIAIVSALYSWYAASFGHFDQTYGSLGALIGFLFWMWISLSVVIVGAELDAELEHQTARDSTVGPPEPMGERNAVMADTLGRAAAKSQDDPRTGKSRNWVQGYEEGRLSAPKPRGAVPLRYILPAAVIAGLVAAGRRRV